MTLSPGSRLGPYEVLSRLGSGGMGEVYRARDPKLNRELAIKVLPASIARDTDFLARFQAEARAASALNHPNIITIHDIGSLDGTSYILMELVDGKTVRELTDAGTLPLKKTLQIVSQAAEGLAAAHARGIVHRDLKPENLMVTRDGVLKILDFGLAKTTPLEGSPEENTVSAAAVGTQPGTVLGTVGYMSPEQASGNPVDFRSDQFSLGTILYEMVAGKRAWKRNTPAETLVAIIREEPAPISAAAPGTPTALRWIIDRCLAKDPEERYASTKDLARDLRYIADHLADLTSASTLVGIETPAAKARFGAASLGIAGLALALGIGAALLLRPAARWNPPSPHYLTYSGRDSDPAISPDGKVLAFTSERNRQSRVYLKQLADGSEAALTTGPDRAPRFSPDGSSLFFTRRDGATEAIYRVAAVGGEPRKVVDNAANGDISPDGKEIVFIRRSIGEDRQARVALCAAPVTGGAERVLLKIAALVHAPPRWSPDGRFVALPYSLTGALGGIPWTIAIVPRDGGAVRTVSPVGEQSSVSSVVWTDGGREIAYMQLDAGYFATSGRIVRQDVGSGASRILMRALNLGYTLDFAGPGRLVYGATSTRGNLREVGLLGGAYPPSQLENRWLTRGYSVDRQPFYAPDGKRIVFTSNRDGNMDIWEMTIATADVRRLTDDPKDDWDPFVTPDGKSLLWSSNRSGNYEIWIANADGTNPRQLSHDGKDAENPTTTPDGNWVFYASHGSEKAGIWKMRIDGSEGKRVLAATARDPQVSPDGRYVGFGLITSEPALRVARLEDGVILPLSIALAINATTGQADSRLRWMPDGRSIALSGRDDQGISGVYVQDFDPSRDTSSTRRRVAGFDPDYFVDTFGVSPDGLRFTLATTERPSDLVLVEGLAGLDPPRRAVP